MLTERVLFNKITPAEFRAIYAELIGVQSVLQCAQSKEASLVKDLRVNNARKEKSDKFCNITSKVIKQIKVVDKCRHGEAEESCK